MRTAGRWLNLTILVGLLVYALRRPISAFYSDRRERIRKEMRQAQLDLEEAQKRLSQVEARKQALEGELEQIRENARRQAEAERLRVLEEARNDSRKIIAAAEREIDNLRRHAREELRGYTAQLAVELAEERIRDSLSPQDRERMHDRFFSGLSAQ